MIIRLRSTQIPQFWEIIKFAVVKVFSVPEEGRTEITNKVLMELEADNYQCFFKINDVENKVDALEITTIRVDKFSGQKSLELKCLYSFKLQTDWTEFFNFGKEFGRSQGCVDKDGRVIVTTETSNTRVRDIVEGLGFTETFRSYTYIG
jgi:hypothetical protein